MKLIIDIPGEMRDWLMTVFPDEKDGVSASEAIQNGTILNENEINNDYKRGWHDALEKTLKETISIHAGVDCFDVVKTETLIGLEMSMNETNDMSIV